MLSARSGLLRTLRRGAACNRLAHAVAEASAAHARAQLRTTAATAAAAASAGASARAGASAGANKAHRPLAGATEALRQLSRAHPAVYQAMRALALVPANAAAGSKLTAAPARGFHTARATRSQPDTKADAAAKDEKSAGAAAGAGAGAGAAAAKPATAAGTANSTAAGASAGASTSAGAGADAKAAPGDAKEQSQSEEEQAQEEVPPEEYYKDQSGFWKRLGVLVLTLSALGAFIYQNVGDIGEHSSVLWLTSWMVHQRGLSESSFPLRHRAPLSILQMQLMQSNDLARIGFAKNQNFVDAMIKLMRQPLDPVNEAAREPMRNAAAILAEITKTDEATLQILRYHPQLHGELLELCASDDKDICVFASTILSQVAAIDEDQRKAFIDAGAVDQLLRVCRATNGEVSGMAALALATVLSDFDDLTAQRDLLKTTTNREREIEVFIAFTRAGETILAGGGNTKLAIKYLKQALTLDPTNFQVLSFLGFEYFKLDQLDEAQAYFEKSLESVPDFAESAYGLAKLRFRKALLDSSEAGALQQLEAAAQLLSRTLSATFVKPGETVTSQYLLLVRILESLDKEGEAIQRSKEWADKTAFDPLAHFTLGRLYLRRANYREAMECFVTANQLDKTKAEVLYYMALTQWRLGNYDNALASANGAITLMDEEEKRKKVLRKSQEEAKRAEEEAMLIPPPPGMSRAPAQPLRERSHNDKVHFLKGKILAAMEQYDDAAVAFKQYVACRPDEPEGHFQWAHMLEKAGRNSESYEHYSQVLTLWERQCKDTSCKKYFDAHKAEAAALSRIAEVCGPNTTSHVERHRDLVALTEKLRALQDMP